ncbi:acid phosphatase [Mycolicibacillus parakoreensis]|uniref:acid phosphatase n=1 Tax=Mycolicibacillus parakoreensis TaxID=1069221 RepID=UPI002AE46EE0|nr:acid phosphatase [Mycolicibacillus parakoreensis]
MVAAQSVPVDTAQPPPQRRLLLLRHGQTEWSKTGQHTGSTDLALTATGRAQATALTTVLRRLHLADPIVLASPRRRAVHTAELAGLTITETTELLGEWDYGAYEGLTTTQIRRTVPDWLVWTHGCPDGESLAEVRARADRAVALAHAQPAHRDVVFVGHSHFSRAVITRWLGLPLADGTHFAMPPASVAVAGFEHGLPQLAALGLTGGRDDD